MDKESINKASLQHVKEVLGESRIISYGMAFGLIKSAFESGVTWCNNQVQDKQNKVTFIYESQSTVIGFGQSPRGMRTEDMRPIQIELNINQAFNIIQLEGLQMYLNDLISAMDRRGQIKP